MIYKEAQHICGVYTSHYLHAFGVVVRLMLSDIWGRLWRSRVPRVVYLLLEIVRHPVFN
jgi:hypothetical protein